METQQNSKDLLNEKKKTLIKPLYPFNKRYSALKLIGKASHYSASEL